MIRLVGRTVAAGVGVTVAQLAWVIWRPLPSYEDLDPDGFEGPVDGTPLRIVALGDSSCTGSGLDDPSDIWLRVLARRLAEHDRRVEVRSFAVGGSKAVDLVATQLEPAVDLGGDIALVSVGGNDALRGERVDRFEEHLMEVASRLTEVFPIVALSGVGDLGSIPRLPRNLAAIAQHRGKLLDAVHKRVAERTGALVADQWAWAVGRFADPAIFSGDLFHPGPEGHRVWAEVAFETVSPALDRSHA